MVVSENGQSGQHDGARSPSHQTRHRSNVARRWRHLDDISRAFRSHQRDDDRSPVLIDNGDTAMPENAKQAGTISDSDRRLMERVHQLVMQAKISEALLQAHFAEEYKLNPARSIALDGTIWESADVRPTAG